MAFQGKCDKCKLRYVWGNVDITGHLTYSGQKIKLGQCWCTDCGQPLKQTTHLSGYDTVYEIPWHGKDGAEYAAMQRRA
jgi:hypothetical protein